MAREAPVASRKKPGQERARATVDAILVAAAHILKTEGFERASTNRIAELAGVSIGSLYSRPPSRDPRHRPRRARAALRPALRGRGDRASGALPRGVIRDWVALTKWLDLFRLY